MGQKCLFFSRLSIVYILLNEHVCANVITWTDRDNIKKRQCKYKVGLPVVRIEIVALIKKQKYVVINCCSNQKVLSLQFVNTANCRAEDYGNSKERIHKKR